MTIADDPIVGLHREVAGISARLDHLFPLLKKVDEMGVNLHAVDKMLAEVRSDIKHMGASLETMRNDIREDLKHNRAIFWSRFAALMAAIMVLLVGLQLWLNYPPV